MKYPDRYAGGIGLEGPDIDDETPAMKHTPARAKSRRTVYRPPPGPPPGGEDEHEGPVAAAGEEIYRYAGGVGLGDDPGSSTPVAAPAVDIPGVVRRYLLPNESDRNIIVIRQHWAILGRQLAALAGALILGIVANTLLYQAREASLLLVRIIWAPLLLAIIWYVAHAADWYTRWIVVTPQRIMTVGGLLRRRVVPLPLKLARDMELDIPFAGRLLGYGTVKTQSFGTDHQLARIHFVPEVDEVFNIMWQLKLPGEGGVMPGEVE